MKELKAKLSRYLSAILMVAMVITSTPQAAMAEVEADLLVDSVVEPNGIDGNEDIITLINPDNAIVNIHPSIDDDFNDDIVSSNDFSFTVSSTDLDAYHKWTVSCSDATKLHSNENGSYTYVGDSEAADAETITITKVQCAWGLTFQTSNATVTYINSNGDYTDYVNAVPVSGGSLDFKVVADTGYEVKSVSCIKASISKAGDVYTVDLSAIDDDIEVVVEVIKQPLVTFNTIGIDSISYNMTDGTGKFMEGHNGTSFPVSANTVLYFNVTPDDNHQEPILVSAGNVPLEKDDSNLYSYTISENTTFTVTAEPIQHIVKFSTYYGITVKYNTVSAGDVYKVYRGPISIPNGEIYIKLVAPEGYEDPIAIGCDYDSESDSFSLKSGLTSIGEMTTITVKATPMKTVSFNTIGASVIYSTVSDGSYMAYTRPISRPKDANLYFKVKQKANYTTPIDVKDNGVTLVSDNEVYCVSMNNTYHDIDVTATPIMYQVSFNCVSDNFTDDGIQYVIDGIKPDKKYTYHNALTVQQCQTVKFKLNLDDAFENPVVKAGDLTLIADNTGVYQHIVTNNTIITVTATRKPLVTFDVAVGAPQFLHFDNIMYKIGDGSWTNYSPATRKGIPISKGATLFYKFSLKDKYDVDSLSVKIGNVEQTCKEGEYMKSGITGNITIAATAKAEIMDVTFDNPTEAMIETISGGSVRDEHFNAKTKKIAVEKEDYVSFNVVLSGNYVGRPFAVKEGNSIINPDVQGVYSVQATAQKAIEVLPNVKYTFTNSGNNITFSDSINGTFVVPQNGCASDAAIISQNNISSGQDYFFKVTPLSGKAIDYVKIDGKVIPAVTESYVYNVYKLNAKVDTAIEVKSSTKYEVKFVTDNGAVAKVCKDKEDKAYSEEIANDGRKILAGAQEFKFKAQADDSYMITSVSVNGSSDVLKADKDGIYTLPVSVVTASPNTIVTIHSEKQKHKVTFDNVQRATIKYEIDGIVSEESTGITNKKKESVKDVVVGSTFMVEAPEGSQVVKVTRGKAATEMIPKASGIYKIESLNADETITVLCRTNATGVKYDGSIVSERELEQTANTVMTYKMKLIGVDNNFDPQRDLSLDPTTLKVGSSVSWSKVDYKTVNVKVTTPYDYTGDTDADVVFDMKEGSNVLATFKVISIKPELKTPSVAVSDIRDDSAVLTLKDRSKQIIHDGKVYYHISATQQVSAAQIEKVDLSALNSVANIPGLFTGGDDGKDIYVPADASSKTFTTKVEVNFRPSGDELAKASGFNVSVNTCISRENGVNKVLDDGEGADLVKDFTLNASKYETNLKLGKVSSKYITGQKGTPIAKIIWGKGTTHRDIDELNVQSSDKVQTLSYADGDFVIEDDIIYLGSTKSLSRVGSYIVEAKPKSNDSNTKTATLKIKVVQGITDLDSANKDISIIRANDKKVTYTLPALIYNEGKTKPDSKKVTYTLGREGGAALTANDKLIKVAKGKITFDRKYVNDVSANYTVTVNAADYVGNDADMVYNFKIKEAGATVLNKDYLYICKLADNQYVPVELNKPIFDAKLYFVATKNKAGEVIPYNSSNIIQTREYSLKCSSSKVAVMSYDGDGVNDIWEGYAYAIDPTVYTKNVTFTATAVDGSRKKAILKKITFEDNVSDILFDVYTGAIGGIAKADAKRTVSTLNNETFKVVDYASVGKKMSDTLVDYSVKADSGLKIVASGSGERTALFTGKKLDGGKACGTLTYTYYKWVKGKRTEVVKKLTLVNENKWVNVAAPSAKQLNTLYSEKENPISIKFEVANKLPVTANKVKITKVADNDKQSYVNLYDESNLSTYATVYRNTFNLSLDTSHVEAGTYKYIVTYGHTNKDTFIEDTAAATLRIKVTEESAKLATTYTMSEVVPVINISGKFSRNTKVTGIDLMNANIGGTINHFKDYFVLSEDGKGFVLKASTGIEGYNAPGIDTEYEAKALQDAIKYLTNKVNRNDLVGYLSYKMDDSNMSSRTVKITMKVITNVKSASAFKSKVKNVLLSGTNIKLEYKNKDTKYAHAYTDAGQGLVSLNASIDYSDNIEIGGKTDDVGQVRNAYIYVLKTDSPYAAYVKGLKGKPKNDAMIQYGVKVKLGTINVIEK